MLNVKLVIHDQSFRPHRSAKGNDIGFQSAMFHTGDGAVYRTELMINPQHPHAPGEYQLSPASFQPGQFGRIEFRPVLIPIAQPKAAPVTAVKSA